MGATFRSRPRAVPAPSIETAAPHLALDALDPNVRAAVQSIQRSLGQLGQVVKTVAAHPTIRDRSPIAVTLVNGTNWINHALGRAPRFVYIAAIASGLTSWWWKQQTPPDADATRIDIEAATGGSVKCLVRLE